MHTAKEEEEEEAGLAEKKDMRRVQTSTMERSDGQSVVAAQFTVLISGARPNARRLKPFRGSLSVPDTPLLATPHFPHETVKQIRPFHLLCAFRRSRKTPGARRL